MKCIYCKKRKARTKYCSRKCSQNAWSRKNRTYKKVKWYSIKYRSNKRGEKYLSFDEFKSWLKNTPQKCEYCGVTKDRLDIPLKIAKERRFKVTPSWIKSKELQIDRIHPGKGYILGNIVLACTICNIFKSSNWSYEEFKEIARRFLKPDVKRLT